MSRRRIPPLFIQGYFDFSFASSILWQGSEPIEAIARATGTSLRFLHVSKHKGITDQTLLVIAGAIARNTHHRRANGGAERTVFFVSVVGRTGNSKRRQTVTL